MAGMTDTAYRFEEESNPRSDYRVGKRLAALMGAADVSPRKLEGLIDKLISYETIRQTTLGRRGLSQKEAAYISRAIGWALEPEVGDVQDWLLSGRSTLYTDYRPPSAGLSNPRSLTSTPLAPVIPIEVGRSAHQRKLLARRTS